jgi:hypothetical protein
MGNPIIEALKLGDSSGKVYLSPEGGSPCTAKTS